MRQVHCTYDDERSAVVVSLGGVWTQATGTSEESADAVFEFGFDDGEKLLENFIAFVKSKGEDVSWIPVITGGGASKLIAWHAQQDHANTEKKRTRLMNNIKMKLADETGVEDVERSEDAFCWDHKRTNIQKVGARADSVAVQETFNPEPAKPGSQYCLEPIYSMICCESYSPILVDHQPGSAAEQCSSRSIWTTAIPQEVARLEAPHWRA